MGKLWCVCFVYLNEIDCVIENMKLHFMWEKMDLIILIQMYFWTCYNETLVKVNLQPLCFIQNVYISVYM